MINTLTKLYNKLFNQSKYQKYKSNEKLAKKLNFYNIEIKEKLEKIQDKLYGNNEINFTHSGHLGDIIYSLPLVQEISKSHDCNFYIRTNKKMILNYENHPSGDVMINHKTANLLIPLLRRQKYLKIVDVYKGERIDIDLDLFRDMPININFHSVRWYAHLAGVNLDMNKKFLDVDENLSMKNKIVIMRSPRYRNPFINYDILKNVNNIVCVGLKSEFEDLKKNIPNLEFYNCRNFLEMAEIIKSSKFFIGNLCFAYSVAEALKVNRLLETCPDFPVVFPIGGKAFDFYHQIHFKKFFDVLNG